MRHAPYDYERGDPCDYEKGERNFADWKEPIKRKRPGTQIAPGHAMGKQVLGGFLAVFFYPLPVFSIIPQPG